MTFVFQVIVFTLINLMIDSHCHLNTAALTADKTLIRDCQSAGLKRVIVPGVKAEQWPDLITLAQQPCINIALGLHPLFAHTHQAEELESLECLLEQNPEVTAIGEIGLDFWQTGTNIEQQNFYFSAQLELASRFDKPIILHARKSHDTILKYLRQAQLPQAGIVHAFSGSQQQAEQYLDLGYKLGIGGAVTHPRAKKLRRLLKALPLNSWVLETDAPDMRPAFIAAKYPNSPRYLPMIAQVQAHILGVSYNDWIQQTVSNTVEALNLKMT